MVRNVLKEGAALLLILVFAAGTISISSASSSNEARENTWVFMAPMPTARSNLGVAVVDGKIYAIGGDASGTNEMYDPFTDTWTIKASMPTPRSSFGIAVYQSKIYCIGGSNSRANEVYDPSTNTWEAKAPMPIARWDLEANVAYGRIYLMGGEPNQTLNEAYDPAANCWTKKAPIPFVITEGYSRAAIYAASAVLDNKIYWIGVVGFFYDPLGMKVLNQMYSPEDDSWSLRAPLLSSVRALPEAAGVTTGVWSPQRIHIFGEDSSNCAYDPANDRWTGGDSMLLSRRDFGVAVVNDKLYVIGGGYLHSKSAMNEQYTPFGYGTPDPTYQFLTPTPTTTQQPTPSPSQTTPPSNLAPANSAIQQPTAELTPAQPPNLDLHQIEGKPNIALPTAIAVISMLLITIPALLLKRRQRSIHGNHPITHLSPSSLNVSAFK